MKDPACKYDLWDRSDPRGPGERLGIGSGKGVGDFTADCVSGLDRIGWPDDVHVVPGDRHVFGNDEGHGSCCTFGGVGGGHNGGEAYNDDGHADNGGVWSDGNDDDLRGATIPSQHGWTRQ